MIHDFATIPKTQQTEPASRHAGNQQDRRWGRYLVLVLAAVFFWQSFMGSAEVNRQDQGAGSLAIAAVQKPSSPGTLGAGERNNTAGIAAGSEWSSSNKPEVRNEPEASAVAPKKVLPVPVEKSVSDKVSGKAMKKTSADVSLAAETPAEMAAAKGAHKGSEEKVASNRPGQARSIPTEEQWGFYEQLSEGAWPIPVQKGTYVKGGAGKRHVPVYMLQAASFKNGRDARALVKRLAKHGLKGTVNMSLSAEGHEWYRVSVGPFNKLTRLNKAQDILVSMNMMPLKIKVN